MPEDSPREFIARVGHALLRLAAVVVLGSAHWLLEQGLPYIIPDNLKGARVWVQDASFPVFMLIYMYLLWDMVKVFIPALQSRAYPGLEGKDESS